MNLRNMLRLRIFPKIRKVWNLQNLRLFRILQVSKLSRILWRNCHFGFPVKKIVNSQNSLLFSSKFQIHNFQIFLKITGSRESQRSAHSQSFWVWTWIFIFWTKSQLLHSVWKSLKMSHLNFSILAFSINFWPIKSDLSGNTVWQQNSCYEKFAKIDYFWHILMNFCPLNM